MKPFSVTSANGTTRTGVRLCGGTCLSTSTVLGTNAPIELKFEYRWLSVVGTVEFRLGNQLLTRLQAPANLTDGFQSVDLILTDPALRSPNSQNFQICVEPENAQVELADLSLRSAAEANVDPPQVTIRRGVVVGVLQIEWSAKAGKTYQVERRPSLVTGDWLDYGPPVSAAGDTLSTTATIAPGQEAVFYRVRVNP